MITGARVVITGLSRAVSSEIFRIVNQETFRELTGTMYPVSEFEHEEWIKRVATSPDIKLFAVFDKETDQFLGTIGLKNFDQKNRNAELFISLDSTGGYGADAGETLVRFSFAHLNLHKIYLKVFATNQRAIRCYEKAGFQSEGVLKQHHFENGEYIDVIVMGRHR